MREDSSIAVILVLIFLYVFVGMDRIDCAIGIAAACEQVEGKYGGDDDHSNP